jgi:hypothetical protein
LIQTSFGGKFLFPLFIFSPLFFKFTLKKTKNVSQNFSHIREVKKKRGGEKRNFRFGVGFDQALLALYFIQ